MKAITQSEIGEYGTLKAEIKGALSKIIEHWYYVGERLRKIKERELYRGEFETWKDFCAKCCEFSRRRADQIIQSTETRAILAEVHGLGTVANITEKEFRSGEAKALLDETQETHGEATKSTVEKTKQARKARKREQPSAPQAPEMKQAKVTIIDAATGKPEEDPAPGDKPRLRKLMNETPALKREGEVTMKELLTELDSVWSFDNAQQHTHSWHDKQDFLERWRAKTK